jgi:Baseplate J-like protein
VKQPTPKIDPRTASDIFRQVVELLQARKGLLQFDADWNAFQPERGVSKALIKVFAHFAELITERLNRVPEKNFLAFVDLLGASLLPPRPARAPLTFSLAETATSVAIVRAGTEVAAVAAEGQNGPVVFETERELVLTPAKLQTVFTHNPASDRYNDHRLLLPQSTEGSNPESVFNAATPIGHLLYLAHDGVFNHPGEKEGLTIQFTLAEQGKLNMAWDGWDAASGQWVEKQRGEIAKDTPIDLKSLNPSPPMILNGTRKRWLRARLLDALTPGQRPVVVSAVTLGATFKRKDRAIATAFTNNFPVDVGRGFFPFGENPLPGDAFYLRLDNDFAEPGCKVTLNPSLSMVGEKPTTQNPRNAVVVWEFWDGLAWKTIPGVTDKTNQLTTSESLNPVVLPFPANAAPTNVNGIEGYWVRVRLHTGSYGPGAEMRVEKSNGNYTYKSIPAAAPLISSIKISYETNLSGALPEALLTYNNFTYESINTSANHQPFIPFPAPQETKPAIYFGFAPLAEGNRLPNNKINLYIGASGEITATDPPEIEWQYSTGEGNAAWASLTVLDATSNFTQSGVVEFLAPTDFAPRSAFGHTRYWLRAVHKSGTYTVSPTVSALLLNTVMARQATRIENEVLGSGDGSKNQRFRTSFAPVLEGQRLDVRELEVPSPVEQEAIKKGAGEDVIFIFADEAGQPLEIWVRWKQVPDFYGSGPRDRHYVLDHLSGEVRFGDGINGMIPPMASGNIRMAVYRTGGGVLGNKPAGAITELRTTVAYVEGVTNHIAASGGTEAETSASLLDRMPRTIRHGDRAVTYEDYEDLAMLASPEVARARCVRFYEKKDIGKVLLIVVPRSEDAKPVPSIELKKRVQEFIEKRKSPLVQLTVAAPQYTRVSVKVDLAPTSLEVANELKLVVLERLNRFLHPLVGGFDGEGWGFGRQPHLSDLYYLIEGIAGVDHVINLVMQLDKPVKSEQYLVASGKLEVNCKF